MGEKRALQKYHILGFLLLISVILLFLGAWGDKGLMQKSALVIVLLVGISFYMTWVGPVYFSETTLRATVATSTSYAFLSLMAIIGIVFILDAFFWPLVNTTFTIFAAICVSTILARMYISIEWNKY